MVEDPSENFVRLRWPIAFLYPPQPLEPCPMPGDFLGRFPRLGALHGEALASLGWDGRLRRATHAWPLRPRSARGVRCAHVGTVAFSWAMAQMLAEAGVTADLVFGHGVGLHSALVASRAVLITDTLEVVDRTAQFLARQPSAIPGAMLAVSGFAPAEIVDFCERVRPPKTVFLAIVNSRRQVVASGLRKSVERLVRQLRAKQAWELTRIPTRLPLHTPLMAQLSRQCDELVEGPRCHVPHVRLIHPTTGEDVRTVSGAERLWRTHLIGMIDFVHCLDKMEEAGVKTYLEVGLGETLTRLGRWHRPDLPILSLGRAESVERVLDARVE